MSTCCRFYKFYVHVFQIFTKYKVHDIAYLFFLSIFTNIGCRFLHILCLRVYLSKSKKIKLSCARFNFKNSNTIIDFNPS
jgi:hypothetical protein